MKQLEDSFFSVFIIGLGLIGGSLGLSLKGKWLRYGYDIDRDVVREALEVGAIDKSLSIEEGLKSDIVVISIPVQFIPYFIRENRDKFYKDSILMDTGSTKRVVVDEMRKVDSFFIGGHPIAGKEKGGIKNIDSHLFDGKIFVLTEENNLTEEKKRIVLKLVRDIGSFPVFISTDDHDYILGLTSHLPYVVSLSLFYYLMKKEKDKDNIFKFAGSGLRDTTRISSGDPVMSYGMIKTNLDHVKRFISEYIDTLEEVIDVIEKGKFKELAEKVKERRDKIW